MTEELVESILECRRELFIVRTFCADGRKVLSGRDIEVMLCSGDMALEELRAMPGDVAPVNVGEVGDCIVLLLPISKLRGTVDVPMVELRFLPASPTILLSSSSIAPAPVSAESSAA